MVVNNIMDIVKGKGLETPEQLHHFVYKYTNCGAYIYWDERSVSIGSTVEGSYEEFNETFYFPVESWILDHWVHYLEELCEQAWRDAHKDEEEVEYDEL